MARLIPRKQIEEQQDLSGSLRIGGDLIVTGSSLFSGSLQVDNDFFLGNELTDRGEITGSVFLTGSLIIDGELNLANLTQLSATASNALLASDTILYDGIRSRDFGANVPTLYVSSTDGDDANDGRSIQYPLKTVKRAALLATPGYDGRYGLDSGSLFNGYVIRVQAGTYLEDNPVILPKNSTIWGAGLRITKILARNKNEDLFWVNAGCYVAEITVGGLELYPDQINPEKGFGFAFQPGAFITTSPYIQNCSQISNQENSFTELYEDIKPGGGGLYVNGDAVHPESPLASMVLDAYTQISPNGVGCLVNGRGFIQLVSFFNNFSYYAIRVNNGGHATLNNSNISFGLYGMYASGSRLISGSGGDLVSKKRVRDSWSVIVDVLNKGGLEEGLPTVTTLNTAEGIRVSSATLYPQSNASLTNTSYIASPSETAEVVSDYNLISEIVENGVANYPTLLAKSSIKGYSESSPYNILGATQITSSISASAANLTQISASIAATISILNNGTGSFTFKSNNTDLIKVTNTAPIPIGTPKSEITGSITSSFGNVINIIKNGLSVKPTLVSNNSASIYVGNVEQVMLGVSSSLVKTNEVSASFSTIYNVLANGTGSNIEVIPANHKRAYTITNINSSSYAFDGVADNPTIKLFRGETYKFYVSASEATGPDNYPFFIRTQPISGITDSYDYMNGVINNGDSVGNITFEVPYNAPSKLYYVADNSENMIGTFDIVNSSTTPPYLIQNTLTYPVTIASSSIAKTDIETVKAYEILTNNKSFIQSETIEFVSSSWADFEYNDITCSRDVGYIVDAVAKDLLYGGNEESIRAGITYYTIPSEATTTQLSPTTTAVKYAAGMAINILNGKTYSQPSLDIELVWENIRDNKQFVQDETIAFLSSSWSGFDGFNYNETKCRRDIGYILDAVATDVKYGGNERSIEAGEFYYKYPSQATSTQSEQTITGIRYAAGLVRNLAMNETFVTASDSKQSAYNLLLDNKELIQNETIEYINVIYPSLKYNQTKCRRDVGYIIDGVATDLLYGGIERGITSGRYYYDYPSIATSQQKRETIAGVRYAKVLADYVVTNQILETPRVITNVEKGIKVTTETNVTSSFFGSVENQNSISSSFGIISNIIKRGTAVLNSIVAQQNGQNWSVVNPLNITNGTQLTSTTSSANLTASIDTKFDIITSIIQSGSSVKPAITSSQNDLIIVSGLTPITSPSASQSEANEISSSIATIVTIVQNGTGSVPTFQSNTLQNIKVTNINQWTGSNATETEATAISSSIVTITNIITNGLGVVPTITLNTSQSIKVTNTPQYISSSFSGSVSQASLISASISLVVDIISGKSNVTSSLLLPTSSYVTPSNDINVYYAYNLLKQNIPFIQAETIAYLSSSWNGFQFNDVSCSRDIGLIVNGAAEDLLYNSYSSSLVNGKYYLEYPSDATGSQLNQTVDGIKYASKLAQKTLQNIVYSFASTEVQNASLQLKNNRDFIQSETIAYLSSSWGNFNYDDVKCKRDIGHVIDAVRTDLVYGGNERSVTAGVFYYLYPSDATGSQLTQTIDGINYASRISQKVVVGTTFVTASQNKTNASNLLSLNKNLIAREVVEYVSSSWYGVSYNQTKCERDVKYIIDAVRTDLVYGGNERSSTAGTFYYLYPSAATVGGVPSVTNQLDPTITGINYGSGLAQKIILGSTFVTASNEKLNVRNLIQSNRAFIQAETIQYTNAFYPYLIYNEASCSRDVGFIVDSVATDIVYGGNERSVESGVYYYKFPSKATSVDQKGQTIDSIEYANSLVNKIVSNIVLSGVNFVTNTDNNIKVSGVTQITSQNSGSATEITNVSASFSTVTQIIEGGVDVKPTIISNVENRVKINNISPITSVSAATSTEIGLITASFNLITDIIENGSSSLPDSLVSNFPSLYGFNLNTPNLWNISSDSQTIGVGTYPSQTNSVSSSFGTVINIISNGTGPIPTLVTNASGSITKTGLLPIVNTQTAGQFEINKVSSGFGIVLDVVENGYDVISTIIPNTSSSIKVTQTPQIISGSGGARLQGKLISASFATVIDVLLNNGTSSIGFVSSSYPNVNTNQKITSAFNLLWDNKQMIVDETITFMSSSWSVFDYNQTKCERDLGLIISGAAFDLLYGGNSSSLTNGKYYFDYPSEATSSQLDQTVTALKYASGVAEKVVQNIVLTHISASATISASYVALTKNKGFIQSESIAYVSSSWSEFGYDEIKCRRDIGYIVDAVRTDLLYGGNERSVVAGRYYYDYPSQATDSQLEPTLTGVRYAKGLALNVIKNSTFYVTSSATVNSYDSIRNNKKFIQSESVAYINAKYPDFYYNEEKCKRDVGYIIDAVATDLLYGGNERSSKAGEFYYLYPSEATDTQLTETVDGIKYAARLVSASINNWLIPMPVSQSTGLTPSNNLSKIAAYDLLIQNIGFIQSESISFLSSSWSNFEYDSSTCSRDVKYIVEAVAGDILYGGNHSSSLAGIAYWEAPSKVTGSQLDPTVTAIDYAKGLATKLVQNLSFNTASLIVSSSVGLLRANRGFIVSESMAYLTASWSTFEYNKEKCARDLGYILDAATTDLLYGGNERSVIAGDFYYKYPSKATLLGDGDGVGQLGQTIDGIEYASRISQKIVGGITFVTASSQASASFDLLRKNKKFIAAEVIEYVSSSWSGVYYNQASCSRDVGYLIDAAATDVLYGGTERAITAGTYYYLFPSNATNKGVPSTLNQLDPTLTGVNYAGRLSTKIVTNPTFTTPSASAEYGRKLLVANKSLIQKETLLFLSSSWSTLQYNEVSCSRDLGFIIDAVATDLIYGGNERSIEAGSYYYRIPSVAIQPSYTDNGTVGQKKQTVDGINYAKGISEKIVTQTQLVFAGTKRRAAVDRLRGSKKELKDKAIGYTNGAFPYLVYNEASCSRDTGLIVDACATDLLYGGNERAIAAASSYYNGQYGSAIAVTRDQLLETLETNRYLRTRAEFIAAGAPLEEFGSLIVATGIDYSYNGAGVTFKALPPNQGGSGVADPAFEITQLGGGRIYFTSGNQDGDFRIGTGLSINQATGTLVGRTFSKSLFSLVTPFSLALQI
jgi:hypothetical protein